MRPLTRHERTERLIKRPDWFTPMNQAQADVVNATEQQYRDLDTLQDRRLDEAKAAALPMMAKHLQSWDSLSDAQITGTLRPGSAEAISRIRRSKRRKSPITFLLSIFRFSP